jgi:hypothetical protein
LSLSCLSFLFFLKGTVDMELTIDIRCNGNGMEGSAL